LSSCTTNMHFLAWKLDCTGLYKKYSNVSVAVSFYWRFSPVWCVPVVYHPTQYSAAFTVWEVRYCTVPVPGVICYSGQGHQYGTRYRYQGHRESPGFSRKHVCSTDPMVEVQYRTFRIPCTYQYQGRTECCLYYEKIQPRRGVLPQVMMLPTQALTAEVCFRTSLTPAQCSTTHKQGESTGTPFLL
jgi:hypothetical protein